MLKRSVFLIFALVLFAIATLLIGRQTEIFIYNYLREKGLGLTVSYQNKDPLYNPPGYAFPKEALESDTPLPEKVKDSFKSTIGIMVRFTLNQTNTYVPVKQEFHGSSFITKDGIISARHIFLVTIKELSYRGMPFTLDKNNLPRSLYYTYRFYGIADINGRPVTFPLELIGMGDPYLSQDFAVFKAIDLPPQLKPLEFEENVKLENGDGRFDEDEIYYSSGRVPSFRPFDNDLNHISKRVLMDFINYNFAGSISAIIPDMPNNKEASLEKIYRINGLINNVEPGFSGGPVFDKNGKVIGMTVYLSPGLNFSHAISAKDLRSFIEKLRKEGRIK